MTPTDVLREEHRLIVRALDVLEALAGRVARNMSLPPEPPRRLIEFFQTFADGIHHAKEEGMLFPALIAAGMPRQGGPVSVMVSEHEDGRRYLRELAEVLAMGVADDDGRERFVVAARSYADMLRHHILKEDQVLWPMAESMLTGEAAAEMQVRFDRHAADHAESRERWEQAVDEVARELFGGQGRPAAIAR